MADGFSTTFVNALLNVLGGVSPTTYATVYVGLFTGDPGTVGTSNVSAGSTTRLSATFGTAASGAISLSTVPTWTNTGSVTEDVTDIGIFSAVTAGTFLTSASVCIPSPTALTGTASTTGGSFAAGDYFWVVTAINAAGETVASNEIQAAFAGTTSSIALSWTAASGATGYKVYRGTASGSENRLITTLGAVTTYTDTGTAGTVVSPPTASTAGKSWSANDQIQLSSLQISMPTSA